MKARKVMLLWHTLRFLKPVQIYGRVWFRLAKPKVPFGLARLSLAPLEGTWQVPPTAGGVWTWKEKGKIHFQAMNETVSLKDQNFWKDFATTSHLQLYHRHYFDALKNQQEGKGSEKEKRWSMLLEEWVQKNPSFSAPGWEPYPTSLRIVNWISGFLLGLEPSKDCLASLATQIRFLQKRFEVHIQGNHLFVNAKSSVFGGCFFQGEEADAWLKRGLKVIKKEIREQVLEDGMNYEMSPMYHAIFLVDLLDLINLSRTYPSRIPTSDVQEWCSIAEKMLRVLQILTHPDGEIALFGDSALGMAPNFEQVLHYAQDLGLGAPPALQAIEFLESSGYVRVTQGSSILLIKAGHLGPKYLLGHAHADSLTFELSHAGKRLIVDTGIDRYGVGSKRVEQRGTEAHNTIMVDGQDSSEVWSGFRVARRACPLPIQIQETERGVEIQCGHQGYQRLQDPVLHTRLFRFQEGDLEIEDHLQAQKQHEYSWNLYTACPLVVTVQNRVVEGLPTTLHQSFGVSFEGSHYQVRCLGTTEKIHSKIGFGS